MRKIVPIALASAIITACAGSGDQTGSSSSTIAGVSSSIRSASSQVGASSQAAISSAPVVASSSSIALSSIPVVSSSVAGSSSAPSVGGGLYSDYIPNAFRGRERYLDPAYVFNGTGFSCGNAGCHGENTNDGITPIDLTRFSSQQLYTYINDNMPFQVGRPEECVGQCAADITAYLLSLAPDSSAGKATCDPTEPLGYSPRALRLLTISEYQNTLEDLLGLTIDISDSIIGDSKKGGFPNNADANVDENRANKYFAAADNIASWAVENGKPFACVNGSCADQFIEEFLERLFRRPITQAERAQYEGIFNTGGVDGLKFALLAALNSPQFLYRSELGRKVSDVLSGADVVPEYRPVEPITVLSPSAFGSGGIQPDGSRQIDLYGSAGMTVNTYAFTGKDSVKIRVRGQFGDGSWPSLKIKIDNKDIDTVVVDSTAFRTYTYLVDGINGNNKYVQLENANQGLHSQSRPLFLGDITFGAAELYIPPKGDEAKLNLADPDSYVLDPYELATLLSYTLTGTAPDDALFAAAGNGGLFFDDQIRTQVERLIDTPRGRERIGAMAGYWFNTDSVVDSLSNRDSALFPDYTMEVRAAMAEEVRELFREIFYNNRPFESLYDGDFTVLNKPLADYYGIASGSTGNNDWRLVDNLTQRGGIVTSGAFMTVNAHPDKSAPILRAVRVREQMLCQHILPPPLLVEDREALLIKVNAEYESGQLTSRQYYEGITDARSCDGCHKYQINPLFGMEDFDEVGKWRSTTKGYTGLDLPVDTSGLLYGPVDVNDQVTAVPFQGAKSLSKELAKLPGIEQCLIEKAFRFVAGLPIEGAAVDSKAAEAPLTAEQGSDFACVSDKSVAAYGSSNHSVRAVLTEMIMQDMLRFRKAK